MLVWPSFNRIVDMICRLENVGSPAAAPVALPVRLVSSIRSVSDTSSSWCVRGVMSMLTPTSL